MSVSDLKIEQTIMPPSKTNDTERERELRKLRMWFEHNSDLPKLTGLDGESVTLPVELFNLLQDITTALTEGLPVSVNTKTVMVSTSQAADILGVSRATMVRFLEENRLKYTQPGKHRRIELAEVLKFKHSITHDRHKVAANIQKATSAWIEGNPED